MVAAAVAFVFCLFAGIWIIWHTGLKTDSDALTSAIGFYFIGKAVFVGSALVLMVVREG